MARSSPAAVELTADCSACGLEAGVVEVYDARVAACRFGLPVSARCKLCGDHHQATFDRELARPMAEVAANRCPGCLAELSPAALDERACGACGARASLERLAEGDDLGSEASLGDALDAWAAREGWTTREALMSAVFCEPSLAELAARVRRRAPLEVVADPFANMGVRTTGRAASSVSRSGATKPAKAAPLATGGVTVSGDRVTVNPPSNPLSIATPPQSFAADVTVPDIRSAFGSVETDPTAVPIVLPAARPEAPAPANLPAAPPASAPPRAIVYPLVSVVAADGEIHPAERAVVDKFLQSEGLPPLHDDEYRVHHPDEVAHLIPRDRREAVVQLMCESATVDGMPDESERRVIRAYAAAWHVPDEKVEFWMWGYESMGTSLMRQLWLKLRRFVLSARWSAEGSDR